MSARQGSSGPVSPEPADLESLYRQKALAELSSADRGTPGLDAVRWSGDVFAEVFLVKGDPGPAEVAGGAALSGPDGDAAGKALAALGFDPASVFGALARPEPDVDPAELAGRMRMQVEAVDPYVVVALDPVAGDIVCAAFTLGTLKPGRVRSVGGRVYLALDGLEASLSDASLKKRVWRQLKALCPRQPSL